MCAAGDGGGIVIDLSAEAIAALGILLADTRPLETLRFVTVDAIVHQPPS